MVRLLPWIVSAWPGLADAWAPTAGVPTCAVAVMPVTLTGKATLVPPRVLTVIGPNGTPFGTVKYRSVLE